MPKINDPRDLEIILLKARLEQTEKAMERLVAQIGITSEQQARARPSEERTRHQDQVSNIYGHREDILDKEEDDKECNCETCVKFDCPNTENDDDEMENVCDIDYDYPDEYYANDNDNTEDDSL